MCCQNTSCTTHSGYGNLRALTEIDREQHHQGADKGIIAHKACWLQQLITVQQADGILLLLAAVSCQPTDILHSGLPCCCARSTCSSCCWWHTTRVAGWVKVLCDTVGWTVSGESTSCCSCEVVICPFKQPGVTSLNACCHHRRCCCCNCCEPSVPCCFMHSSILQAPWCPRPALEHHCCWCGAIHTAPHSQALRTAATAAIIAAAAHVTAAAVQLLWCCAGFAVCCSGHSCCCCVVGAAAFGTCALAFAWACLQQ